MKKAWIPLVLALNLAAPLIAMDGHKKTVIPLPVQGALKISFGFLSCLYGLSQFGVPVKIFSPVEAPSGWSIAQGSFALCEGSKSITTGITNMLGTETWSPDLKHHIKEYAMVGTQAITVGIPLYATLYHMGRLKK